MIPQEPSQLFHLAAAGELQPVVEPQPELPAQVSGMPAFYYWKDAIVVGSYVHPARRFSLDITRDRLDGYVTNFNRMATNGVAVPILMDHAPTASSALGWIVSVKRDGDRLMELHQFLGESARDIGLRNKVSLGIDPHFVDGKGTEYGEAIVHSAVTPVPVVPNQGEFEPVNLSDDNQPEQAIELSLEPFQSDTARRTEPESLDLSNNAATKYSGNPRGPENRAAAHVPATDPQFVLHALELVASMKRDLALSLGAIDPAVADELFDLLVKPRDGSANTMLLSRTPGGSSIAIAVFDALSRNHPAPLGEATPLQVLTRIIPGDDTADLQERMIALASGRGNDER
jgi:hypothetical protein